jgi:hypothetical protein
MSKQIPAKRRTLGVVYSSSPGGFRVKTYTYFSMFVRCIGGNRGNLNQVFYSVSYKQRRIPLSLLRGGMRKCD